MINDDNIYDLSYYKKPNVKYWLGADDEELAVKLLYGRDVSYVSDGGMTEYLRTEGIIEKSGAPDATIFEETNSLKDGVWNNVKMVQVFRGYYPDHFQLMIVCKLHKCQSFLQTLRDMGKEVNLSSFVFGIFVPNEFLVKATEIIAHANQILADTIYKLFLLDSSKLQDEMFGYMPSSEVAMKNCKRKNWYPMVKDKTIEQTRDEILCSFDNRDKSVLDDEDVQFCLANLFSEPQ